MNTPSNTNVVHESEAQRQHARVRIPGDVVFVVGSETLRCRLIDLSAGGFAFEVKNRAFKRGELLRGELRLKVDGIGLTVPVHFNVRNFDASSGRTGVAFQDLGPREVAALRHIITSFLAGELVSVGDVLHTLGRDNFTKSRATPTQAAGQGARRKAVALSSLMLAAGAAAFVYAGSKLYDLYFVAHATAAKVSAPILSVAMPRDGVFTSLVPADGIVKKGAPLGSFQTSVSDVFDTEALSKLVGPEQLAQVIGQSVKGTITSPCDCRVQMAYTGDQQYVGKGQRLFDLAPENFKPHVLARFRHEDIDRLNPGTRVSFRITGESDKRVGRIVQVRSIGVGDALDGDVVVQIEPLEPLSVEFVSRPVALSTGGLSLPTSVDALSVARAGR